MWVHARAEWKLRPLPSQYELPRVSNYYLFKIYLNTQNINSIAYRIGKYRMGKKDIQRLELITVR